MPGLQNASVFENVAIWIVLAISLLGLGYALLLRSQILKAGKGTPKMQEVWNAIREGANAYLNRQLKTIVPFIAVLTVVLFFSVYVIPPSTEATERFRQYDAGTIQLIVGFGRAVAFIMGSCFSLIVGQFGMRMAVQGNV
ncbi:MAG: sodium/proton-translocating pyrophosphatase, partial [Oscillospiraceae bacterium]|nr:sodium/proton-translocating pyrophosphatase [Oscillospiraceae bacterium]